MLSQEPEGRVVSRSMFPWLVLLVTMTVLVVALTIYRNADAYRHHPFSLIEMLTVLTAMPWYLRLYLITRSKVMAAGSTKEIAALALDAMARGITLTAIVILLALSSLRFFA